MHVNGVDKILESLGIYVLTIGFIITIILAIYLAYKLFRAMFDSEDE